MIDPKLHGQVALITGANAGIGATIAKALAEQAVRVVIHYLGDPSEIEDNVTVEHTVEGEAAALEVVEDIRASGGDATSVSGDLSDVSVIPELFEHAEARFGPVTILVNNAAHCELPDTIFDTSAERLDRHFDVNTRATVLLMHEFARRYQDNQLSSGRIINISTDSAQRFATQIAYGASKAAIEAFTRSVAIELGPLGVTVNAVAPGPVQTGWIDGDLEEQLLETIPLRRIGQPRDIADTIVFLASDQARWITGQVVKVSGGHAI